MVKIFLKLLHYVSLNYRKIIQKKKEENHFLFLVKKYLIVLTCILNDKKENIIVLYLYPDKTKTPYKYFQLEKNDQ